MTGFKLILELFKFPVAIASTITGIVCYVVRRGKIDTGFIFLFLSLLFLASGACGVNQVQERTTDALMERTKARPVASRRISAWSALVLSLFVIVVGVIFLYSVFGFIPALLGLLAVFWYNIVYTNMKKWTPFAPFPGALVGLFPPAIGWISAGGHPGDFNLWIFLLAAFLYQFPHFLLLFLHYEDDYRKAGFSLITDLLMKENVKNLIFVWSFGIVVLFLFFITSGITFYFLTEFTILILSGIFIYIMFSLSKGKVSLYSAFMGLNIYIFSVFFLLFAERISFSF